MKLPDSLPTALILSSDLSKISFFKRALKGSYYVMDAKESMIALEWLKTMSVEILILDSKTLDEPVLNLCKHIRKIPGCETLPILLITNKLQKTFTIDCLKAGVSDFLHEPLSTEELYERIAVALKSRFVNKKMSLITAKIQSRSRFPQTTRSFLNRLLLDNKTLSKISEQKQIAMPLSLLLIQLDHIEKIETVLGELALDEVIEALTALLEDKLRPSDTLIPQGGGKFLLLLPKTPTNKALGIAEEIRKEISATPIQTKKKPTRVTVSIGSIGMENPLANAGEAYEQFDLSLMRVKKALDKAQKTGNKIIST